MDIIRELENYTKYSIGMTDEDYNLELEDEILNNIDLSQYELCGGTFAGVTFNECDFTDVYLSNTFFGGCIFHKCILKNNILKKSSCDYCEIKNGVIENLDAFRTSFIKAIFENVIIKHSKLIKCELTIAY